MNLVKSFTFFFIKLEQIQIKLQSERIISIIHFRAKNICSEICFCDPEIAKKLNNNPDWNFAIYR